MREEDRLDRVLDAAQSAHADRLALSGPGQRLTYADWAAATNDIALELADAQLVPDEPVLVSVRNRALDLAAWQALWRAGGVAVPVHADAPVTVFEDLRKRVGARYLLRGASDYAWPGSAQAGDHGKRLRRLAPEPPPRRSALEGAAFVVFTSGSTGTPKGVILAHREYTGKLRAIQEQLHFQPDEKTLLILQLTFSFGQWVSLLTLATGGQLVLVSNFKAAESLRHIGSEQVHRVAAVPTMMRAWLGEAEAKLELPRLREAKVPRVLIAGGEPLAASLGRAWRQHLPDTGIADVFGLTETNTSDFILRPDGYDAGAGSIGWPTSGVEFRIVDERGAPVAPGAAGELQIRSRFRMRGYLDQPEATAATLDGDWLKTGDFGAVRSDGSVELIGRGKDIIVRGGNKISPLEVEAALLSHPCVSAALAAGVPDELMGERIHVLAVADDRLGPPEVLRAWAAERLEKFKVPDKIHLVEELPLGRTGKADRAALRRWVLGQRSGANVERLEDR